MRAHHQIFASVLVAVALSVALPAPSLAKSPPAGEAKLPASNPEAKRISGSEKYFPTFGLRATIARDFKLHGVLSVDAGLDIPDAKTRKRAEALKPRILSSMRDAVLSYASLSYIVGERPDADMLRTRMQKEVDAILGKGEAQVVLATVIIFPK